MRIIRNMPSGRRRAFTISAIVGGSVAIAGVAFPAILALTLTIGGSVTPSASPTFSTLTQDALPIAGGSGDAVCPTIAVNDVSAGAISLGNVTGFVGDTCSYALMVKPSNGSGFVGLSASTPVSIPVSGTNATLVSNAQLSVVGGNARCVISFTLTVPATAVTALDLQLKPTVDTRGGYTSCPA